MSGRSQEDIWEQQLETMRQVMSQRLGLPAQDKAVRQAALGVMLLASLETPGLSEGVKLLHLEQRRRAGPTRPGPSVTETIVPVAESAEPPWTELRRAQEAIRASMGESAASIGQFGGMARLGARMAYELVDAFLDRAVAELGGAALPPLEGACLVPAGDNRAATTIPPEDPALWEVLNARAAYHALHRDVFGNWTRFGQERPMVYQEDATCWVCQPYQPGVEPSVFRGEYEALKAAVDFQDRLDGELGELRIRMAAHRFVRQIEGRKVFWIGVGMRVPLVWRDPDAEIQDWQGLTGEPPYSVVFGLDEEVALRAALELLDANAKSSG